MPELRKDLVRDAWVVIAKGRALRPNDFPINKNGIQFSGNKQVCPFCTGNEQQTPPEITAYRKENSLPNTPDCDVRTVPNKYSAFNLQEELIIVSDGINSSCTGVGQHEVIIETPEHGIELHDFTVERINLVFNMFKERYIALANDDRIKYIQIYKNRGIFAGASLEHSHSQILALPMVPQVNKGLMKYYQEESRCLICDMIEQEMSAQERVIHIGEEFIVICPYAPRFAYEVWIVPIKHTQHFAEINDSQLEELALICQKMLKTLIACLDNPAYNIVINSAPVNNGEQEGYHWFMEINPRLIITAGVEVATGIYMNPVAPELAAQLFKEFFESL
ncbi:MAG: DUF4931 domain-containing protein [Syntrophomonadaceae bacterium]|nr:DUF4931 domain-containing protein [Syntrophomonadaceae bacterium]